MKKLIFLLVAFVLLLLAFNVVILNKYKKTLAESELLIDRYNDLSAREARESSILKKQAILQQVAETMLLSDIEFKSPKNNSNVKLSALLKSGNPKLFFRFKETDCDACVQSSLRLIEETTAHMPRSEIVILSGYKNARQFYAYAEQQLISVYNADNLPTVLDEQEQPYFFVMDSNLRMQNVFIPTKEDVNYTADYLNCVSHKYWPHSHDEHNH